MTIPSRKRKAEDQGGRTSAQQEAVRRIFEDMHRIQAWSKLNQLEFYVDRRTHSSLTAPQRHALEDALNCKTQQGDFDILQHEFNAKLWALDRAVRGYYPNVINFLLPDPPSRSDLTTLALGYLSSRNVRCLDDLMIAPHARYVNFLKDKIISSLTRPNMSFDETRIVTEKIQEFIQHLFVGEREILYLHLLVEAGKPHPAHVSWVQDSIMAPGVVAYLMRLINDCPDSSSSLTQLVVAMKPISQHITFPQPGLTAADIYAKVAELSLSDLEMLTKFVRTARVLVEDDLDRSQRGTIF